MKNIRNFTVAVCLCFFCGIPSQALGWPPQPFIIAGSLSINGNQVKYDDGNEYIIVVTNPESMPFSPAAEDRDGLRAEYDTYHISIPIYHETRQPTGAIPGETVILHVYKNGSKLMVTSPSGGRITVGGSAQTELVNIAAMTGPSGSCYSQEEIDAAVAESIRKWDAGQDGRIGLEEAIRALQVVSGIRTE